MYNQGYLLGVAAGEEVNLQVGFDDGYVKGWELGVVMAELKLKNLQEYQRLLVKIQSETVMRELAENSHQNKHDVYDALLFEIRALVRIVA